MELLGALLGVCALLLVAAVPVGLYLSRQRTLSRRVGSFPCLVRGEDGRGWVAGTAQYGATQLSWWRTLSLAPRPARAWSRATLTLVERVPLDAVDDLGQQQLLLHCEHEGERFQLLISAPACAGLVSWLESGPRPVGRVI
ncbi:MULTISPECIES: DUF2550 domain-containing protein [unclassified Actinotalea]|uniref:DUF2550 domain-containing protein n=1 Tax=unclassified Actinotalea TaxID=2638618 RepID=UPI0015F64815|nr:MULTISPECIES: DUF2550 domain-containing protein [unclassified Actinotalea]